MISTIYKSLLLLSGACILLTSCVSSPPTQFYALEPVHIGRETPQQSASNNMLIGIGPVELPKILDRTQFVTRHENNRVQLAEFHQWGESLQENVTRVLARNIAALRSNDVIRVYPWGAFGKVDYRVVLNFLQFDSTPGKSVMLEADWSIMDENNQIILNGHSIIEQQLQDQSYSQTVTAMNKALGKLSQELSIALDNVSNDI